MSIIHLTAQQRRHLRAALAGARDARLYRRLLALLELGRGRPLNQVAGALGVTRQSLYNWVRLFERGGEPLALADRYGVGRPTLWEPGLQRLLRDCLRS